MTLPEEIATMILQNDMGVLSTCAANTPHASLMAYAALPNLEYILMATSASTRKWANLSANPGMALLIDERCTVPDRTRMRALTVGGTLETPPDDHTLAVVDRPAPPAPPESRPPALTSRHQADLPEAALVLAFERS